MRCASGQGAGQGAAVGPPDRRARYDEASLTGPGRSENVGEEIRQSLAHVHRVRPRGRLDVDPQSRH